jgi:hypothetical protein
VNRPEVRPEPDPRRATVWRRWLVPAALLVPMVPLLVAGLLPPGSQSPPTGDHAALELYVRQAAEASQLLGPYSRFHFHHPGPIYFYLSLPFYWLTGETYAGLGLAALLINLATILATLHLVRSVWGAPAQLSLGIFVSLLVFSHGPGWLESAWNPHVVVLPFGLALFAFAAVAEGRAGTLPLAVLAASFAVQTHVASAPVMLVTGSAALALLVSSRLRRLAGLAPVAARKLRRAAILSALLLVVLWAPPSIEQLSHDPGNFERLYRFASEARGRHPLSETSAAFSASLSGFLLDGWPWRMARTHSLRPSVGQHVLSGVLVSGLLVVCGLARRRRWSSATALGLVGLAALAAGLGAATRVAGRIMPYLLQSMATIGIVAGVVLIHGLALLVGSWGGGVAVRRLRALAGGLAGVLLVCLVAGNLQLSRASASSEPGPRAPESALVGRVMAQVGDGLPAPGVRRVLVRVLGPVSRPAAIGLCLALDKRGVSMAVAPFGPFRFTGRRAPNGSEDAMLLIKGQDPELAARPGAEELGGEGGFFVYLLTDPQLFPPGS